LQADIQWRNWGTKGVIYPRAWHLVGGQIAFGILRNVKCQRMLSTCKISNPLETAH